ncbi:MAG: methionyl-tRNA synthetase [Patescibacteria group bacterium]|nr:methionyl-tRNA synthetase [Patescibacteria group bacterium]
MNGLPHIGFALEVVQADVIARYQTLLGNEVVFNIGTDEHGVKIYEEAEKRSMTPQVFCDEMSEHFRSLKSLLDISYTDFIRTTDAHHIEAAQEFWRRCLANGDIYKKQYQMKYCVGCELEKTDSELVDGKCVDHPNREIEIVEEENYFFRFSKFQDALLALYGKDAGFVVPEKRLNEIRAFVERGPQDFSISRLAKKMPWGIPVPDDAEHVMYVWFDALVNYISTLGWPDEEKFSRFWPGVQIAGKDNLRQQSAMWQAMLLSASVAPSAKILIHGHITNAGQKMSKSLGNVIAPSELVEKFGIDGARYILLSAAAFGEDIDITWERMSEKYNADLANGLGNLTSRLIKLSEKLDADNNQQLTANGEYPEELQKLMDEYRMTETLEWIIGRTRALDKKIAEVKPWELVKTDMPVFEKEMTGFLTELSFIASALSPFLPQTSEKILKALQEGKTEPLFQRI